MLCQLASSYCLLQLGSAELGLESARVVAVFYWSGEIATTPNGLFDLSGVTTFSKYFARAPP